MDNINDIIKENTLNTFKGKVDNDKLEKFIQSMPDYGFKDGLLIPSNDSQLLSAKASIKMFLFYGEISCFEVEGYRSTFSQKIWGLGAGGFDAVAGGIYNAYEGNNWPYFFRQAAYAHAQGAAGTVGVIQITWFDNNKTPIGQYNGAAVGAGAFEVGCDGHWNVND